jgi:hypothetical protein
VRSAILDHSCLSVNFFYVYLSPAVATNIVDPGSGSVSDAGVNQELGRLIPGEVVWVPDFF